MTDPSRSPLDTLLDAVVYAPIGAVFHGPETVSELAHKGRGQVANARIIGTFALQKASVQARDWAESAQAMAADAAVAVARATGAPLAGARTDDRRPSAAEPAADTTATDEPPRGPRLTVVADTDDTGSADAAGSDPSDHADVPDPTALPIPDYDTLSASQVVPRLDDLAEAELAEVERYERAHRGRMTILGRIAQLRAS
ncbi:MAG: hypothetical protein ACXIVQ_01775 [Acidimicrobiales bacterium]